MKRDVPAPAGVVTQLLPTGGWSLAQAQEWLRLQVDEGGARCPCCTQFAKRYRRKLYATQARSMIYAYRTFGLDYFHLSKLDVGIAGVRQADFPKLAYWELVTKHPERAHWRITAKGEGFLRGLVKVPETVVLYDSRLQGLEGRPVGVREVLASAFDYDELMS